MNIIACGIDQGLAYLGYAIIQISLNDEGIEDGLSILEHGTFTTSSKEEFGKRLFDIHSMITNLNSNYNTNIMGCEKLFFNPIQKTGRNKSASIMTTNMVSGVIFLISGQRGIYAKDFTPGTVKKYVAGSGRANKENVIEAVSTICEKQEIIPGTEHEADAIAIGITTARYYVNELLPNLIKEATELVSKAETRLVYSNCINALNLVEKIPDCNEKNTLLNRLNQLYESLYKKAEQLVSKAETRQTAKNYENALKSVNNLPDSNSKYDLISRLSKIA